MIEHHHRKNLAILALYLYEKPDEVMTENEVVIFDMLDYVQDYESGESCGTVRCAVGHAPIAGIPVSECECGKFFTDWAAYALRVFGLNHSSIGYELTVFNFLFSNAWCRLDNSAKGAAKRIAYFLMKDLPQDIHNVHSYADVDWKTFKQFCFEEFKIS